MKLFFFYCLVLMLANCRSKPPKDPGPNSQVQSSTKNVERGSTSIEAQQLAADEESKYVTEIGFKENSHVISDAGKNEIKA